MSDFVAPKAPSLEAFKLPSSGTPAFPVEHLEQSVQVIKRANGDKALWGIVTDFNIVETAHLFAATCDAFRKLGHAKLADDLWARFKGEPLR